MLNAQNVALTAEDYHGTMVASAAAAAFNGVGAEGVYSGAALRSYDFDYATWESYVQGFVSALQAGPSVINMSFGGPQASRADYELMIAAFEAGSVLVAASGNEYAEGNPISYPAAYPHVLTVGAIDQTGAPASFSSSGLARRPRRPRRCHPGAGSDETRITTSRSTGRASRLPSSPRLPRTP